MTQRINEKLGGWMLENNETRTSTAQKLHISKPTFNTRISGKSEWKWEEAVAISKLIGVSLDELAR